MSVVLKIRERVESCMRQPVLSEGEFDRFREFIYTSTGIKLGGEKKEMLHGRLAKRLRALHIDSFGDYLKLIKDKKSSKEFANFVDAISTNKTDFFRENTHFEYLEKVILPAIAAEKSRRSNRRLRIWSAACATGEEPYSIALVLHRLNLGAPPWDSKILGTDISTGAVKCALSGEYRQEQMAPIPPAERHSYFSRLENGNFKVGNELRRMVKCGQLNLLQEDYPFRGPFDLIFCRNVMIYFDLPTRERLVSHLYGYLAQGGHLFIGLSESVMNISHQYENVSPSVYRKNSA